MAVPADEEIIAVTAPQEVPATVADEVIVKRRTETNSTDSS